MSLKVTDVFRDGREIQVSIDDRNTTTILVFRRTKDYENFRGALLPAVDIHNLKDLPKGVKLPTELR
jgi:hypothetical protein